MKTIAVDKSRSAATLTVTLDPADRDRIASLAAMKERTPHFLMKEAILEYMQREEARLNFTKAAETSFEHYKETGLHITLDEFSEWVDEAQQSPHVAIPICHR